MDQSAAAVAHLILFQQLAKILPALLQLQLKVLVLAIGLGWGRGGNIH